jgi:hypothetical protein
MSVKALVDYGATGHFINSEYIISQDLPVHQLSQPIPVLNIDGNPNLLGSISGIVDMVVGYRKHSEWIQLAVTCLGKQHVILGYSWLQKHTLEINWETKEVWMKCCPASCSTCRDKLRAACRSARISAVILYQLREGPTPSICAIGSEEWLGDDGYDLEDNDSPPVVTPGLDSDSDSESDEPLEEGNRRPDPLHRIRPSRGDLCWDYRLAASGRGLRMELHPARDLRSAVGFGVLQRF